VSDDTLKPMVGAQLQGGDLLSARVGSTRGPDYRNDRLPRQPADRPPHRNRHRHPASQHPPVSRAPWHASTSSGCQARVNRCRMHLRCGSGGADIRGSCLPRGATTNARDPSAIRPRGARHPRRGGPLPEGAFSLAETKDLLATGADESRKQLASSKRHELRARARHLTMPADQIVPALPEARPAHRPPRRRTRPGPGHRPRHRHRLPATWPP
jgi:hypothetical protein